MNVTQSTIDLIKQFEGFSTVPYHGEADRPEVITVGYGTIRYPNGTWVKLTDSPITQNEAEAYLKAFIEEKAKRIGELIKVPLSQNQADAILSFTYNVGIAAFMDSTLRACINAGASEADIRAAFAMWNKSNGRIVNGLVKRRLIEADRYFKK